MTTATPATPPVPAGAGRGGKHQQVRRRLDEVMAQLGVGEPLPAGRDLAADFGVARMTLRRVVDALVEEGRLIRRQGAGTFVSPRRLDQRLSATSFSDDMRSRGLRPGARTLWARQVPAGMLLASVLGVLTTSPVLHVRRLRTADDEPMAVEDLHVPVDVVPGLDGDALVDASFYAVLADRFGLRIAAGTQTVAPCLVSPEDAAVLDVAEGSPAFLFERTSRLEDGRAVEFVRSVYRGDLYRIVVDIFPTDRGPNPAPERSPNERSPTHRSSRQRIR